MTDPSNRPDTDAAAPVALPTDHPDYDEAAQQAAELAALEAEFAANGGRGVELAERIDALRAALAAPVDLDAMLANALAASEGDSNDAEIDAWRALAEAACARLGVVPERRADAT